MHKFTNREFVTFQFYRFSIKTILKVGLPVLISKSKPALQNLNGTIYFY